MNSFHLLTKQSKVTFAPSMQPTRSEHIAMRSGAVPAGTLVGAGAGGVGGAAVGGLAGLGAAVFDDENDGIKSTLKKILLGAATGGLAGGTLGAVGGGGITMINRTTGQRKLDTMDQWERLFRDKKLSAADALTESSIFRGGDPTDAKNPRNLFGKPSPRSASWP